MVEISCYIFKRRRLKIVWCWKRRHISHFLTPSPSLWKLGEGWERSLYRLLKLCLRPNLRNTFDGHPVHGWWARCIDNKKLIRRWDSERELSLRRHRARTTKYNRLVYKCRHRSTRLCVGTLVFTKFSEITQYNGHYVVQGHSKSPILVPIESSYTTSYQWLILT